MTALNFFSENRTAAIVTAGAIIIGIVIAFIVTHSSHEAPPPPPPPVTMVIIQPPKPPPPPPPLPQPKTITPPKMAAPAMKPVTPAPTPPKTAAPSPSHLGTSIKGNGPNAFDLSGTPGGLGFGNGLGDGGGGSALSYFESVVQAQIRDALAKNRVTRNASAGLEMYLWLDPNGVVTQVQLVKSSGDPKVDDAVTNQVLLHMRVSQLPPAGTPMPIHFSLVGEQAMQ
jgi:hypothetical protein